MSRVPGPTAATKGLPLHRLSRRSLFILLRKNLVPTPEVTVSQSNSCRRLRRPSTSDQFEGGRNDNVSTGTTSKPASRSDSPNSRLPSFDRVTMTRLVAPIWTVMERHPRESLFHPSLTVPL